jgi:hypothetical protein
MSPLPVVFFLKAETSRWYLILPGTRRAIETPSAISTGTFVPRQATRKIHTRLGKGNQIFISQQCEHPLEAWEWIKYLTSKETEEYFYGDQYRRCVPTRLAVLRDPQYLHASRPPYHTDVFVDVLDRARELPIDESFFTWTTTAQRFVDLLFLDPSADLKETMIKCTKAVDIDLQSEHERYERYARER